MTQKSISLNETQRNEKTACRHKFARHTSPESHRPVNPSTQRPESAVLWDIAERLQENFQRVGAILDSITDTDGPRTTIEAAAERGRHFALAQKTLVPAARVDAVQVFETTVQNVLEESGAAIRKRVIDKLNHRLRKLAHQSHQAESRTAVILNA